MEPFKCLYLTSMWQGKSPTNLHFLHLWWRTWIKRIWKLLLICTRNCHSATVSWGRKCCFAEDKHWSKHPPWTCAVHNCSFYGTVFAQSRCPALIGFLHTHTETPSQKLQRYSFSANTRYSLEWISCTCVWGWVFGFLVWFLNHLYREGAQYMITRV